MKKIKFIKPILVASAAATPIPMLFTSCSNANFDEIAEAIKETQISIFMEMAALRRPTYAEAQMFNFVWEKMANLGERDGLWQSPTGYDEWTRIDQVKDAIQSALDNDHGSDEHYDNDYYQLALHDPKFPDTGLEHYGNLWYDIPAVGSEFQDAKPITLQAHMDMNIEFAGNVDDATWKKAHSNWLHSKEGAVSIEYDQDSELMSSDGNTSLGADNGLGCALMMAIAAHYKEFNHCKIRLLFTCDESGSANFFDPDGAEDILASGADVLFYDQLRKGNFTSLYNGKEKSVSVQQDRPLVGDDSNWYPFGPNFEYYNIISLDGKTKNEIFQSAAGVHECHLKSEIKHTGEGPSETVKTYDFDAELTGAADKRLVGFHISGLHGGHSGYDINNGFANALQILIHVLNFHNENFELTYIASGDSPYSICSEAGGYAILPVEGADPENPEKSLEDVLDDKKDAWTQIYKSEYPREVNLKIGVEICKTIPEQFSEDGKVPALCNTMSQQMIQFSKSLWFGPLSWFPNGEVLTSCNFAPFSLSYIPETQFGAKDDKFAFAFDSIARSALEAQLIEFTNDIHVSIDHNLQGIIDPKKEIEHVNLPVWPAPEGNENKLLNRVVESYQGFKYKPKKINSHAWLEIASFPRIFNSPNASDPHPPYEGYPNMVCFGPTIEETHTINETVWTDTINSYIKVVLFMTQNTKGLDPQPWPENK